LPKVTLKLKSMVISQNKVVHIIIKSVKLIDVGVEEIIFDKILKYFKLTKKSIKFKILLYNDNLYALKNK
jgi:hypothetical protein